jgi:hypothetical protein
MKSFFILINHEKQNIKYHLKNYISSLNFETFRMC